jgi:hypothetical protein
MDGIDVCNINLSRSSLLRSGNAFLNLSNFEFFDGGCISCSVDDDVVDNRLFEDDE